MGSSPKELSQVTSVAKQLDPAAQSKDSGNVDWEIPARGFAILL
jgi:hypothetical protein